MKSIKIDNKACQVIITVSTVLAQVATLVIMYRTQKKQTELLKDW